MAKAHAQTTFESVLDMPVEMAERPKPLPRGSYLTMLVGQPRYDKSSKKQTEFYEFTHQILEPLEDVDPDDWNEFLTGPDGEKQNASDITIRNTYYLVPKAAYRLREFLTHCGIPEEKGKRFSQAVAETTGCQVGIHVKHEPWENGEGISARIDRTIPAE